MHDHHTGNGHASREGLAQLSRSLEKALDQNRSLLEDMARFTKDESLRLAHMQLDQAGNAFTHFQERRDIGDLFGAQQEWARQVMQEYATLGLHYAEMFRTMTQHVQAHVESAAGEFQQRAEEEAEDLGHDLKTMAGAHAGWQGEQGHLPAE